MRILVVPDSHDKPGVANTRYHLLANVAFHYKPDVIVNIGDWADMPSLCSYDKGTKSFEGRRYKEDIKAANDAIRVFETRLSELTAKEATSKKKKKYVPQKITTWGNHEHRIVRAANSQPELHGTISLGDIRFADYGWTCVPYMVPTIINGVAFAHCFGSGVMNRPISSEHQATTMIKKKFMSCVAGHTHLRDFAERTSADGTKLNAMTVGCYLEPGQVEDYAGEAQNLWWNGLVVMHDVKNGSFDPEFIGMERIQREFA